MISNISKMTKLQSNLILFSLSIMLSILLVNSSPVSDSVMILEKAMKGSGTRNLLSFRDSWTHSAIVYEEINFEGVATTVLTGFPIRLYARYISFEVGSTATLRIVDYQNNFVYRFEAGRSERYFEIDSNDWEATVDHPIPDDSCVMLYQYERFHGYFKQYCIVDSNYNICEYFEIYGKYSSITFGEDNIELAVIIPNDRSTFLPLRDQRSFHTTGTSSYLFLLNQINDHESYLIDTDYQTSGNSLCTMIEDEYTGDTFDDSKFLFVLGYYMYVKAQGETVSYSLSGKRPYLYFQPGEEITVYAHDWIDNGPSDNEVYVFANTEMFSKSTTYTYTGTPSDTYSAVDFRSVMMGSDLMGVVVGLSDSRKMFLRGGPLPTLTGITVTSICLVPSTPDDDVYIWQDSCFLDYQNDLASFESNNWYIDDDFSMVVGRNMIRFGLKSDTLNMPVYRYPPGVYSDENISPNGEDFYFYTDIYEEIKSFVDNDCVRSYDSTDYFYDNYVELCIDSPEDFNDFDLSDTRFLLFPSSPNFQSVILFKENPGCDPVYSLEINLNDNTSFSNRIDSLFDSFTMVPAVTKNTVYLYQSSYYRGELITMDSSNTYVPDIDTRTVRYLSAVMADGTTLRIIDTSERTVTTYTKSFKSHKVYNNNIYVQFGTSSLINEQVGTVWTFDDNTFNYPNMKILFNKVFYDSPEFSSDASMLYFPNDNSVAKAILINNLGYDTYTHAKSTIVSITTPRDRALILPSNFNGVAFGDGPMFRSFEAVLGESTMVYLNHKRTFSFVTGFVDDLLVYDMNLIGERSWDPSQVGVNGNTSVRVFTKDTFVPIFNVLHSGFYSFTLRGNAPKSVLLDCVLIFKDCIYDFSTTVYRFCTSTSSYKKNDIHNLPVNTFNLGVVVSQPPEGSKKYRSYSGVHVGGQWVEKTRCIAVKGPVLQVQFKR